MLNPLDKLRVRRTVRRNRHMPLVGSKKNHLFFSHPDWVSVMVPVSADSMSAEQLLNYAQKVR